MAVSVFCGRGSISSIKIRHRASLFRNIKHRPRDLTGEPMTNRKTLSLILLMAGVASAEARVYNLRGGDQVRLELTIEKTGLLSGKKHLFTFSQYEGTLRFDRERPEASTVLFSLQAATILCRDTWLSAKDLRKVQE